MVLYTIEGCESVLDAVVVWDELVDVGGPRWLHIC